MLMAKIRRMLTSFIIVSIVIMALTVTNTTAAAETEITICDVNLRMQPVSSNEEYWEEIPAGTKIEPILDIETAEGMFVLCRYNCYGFVPAKYLSEAGKKATPVVAKTTTAVNLRKQPEMANTEYYVEVPGGTKIEAFGPISCNGGSFFLASYNGVYGFIPARWLDITPEEEAPATTSQEENAGVLTTTALDLRLGLKTIGAKVITEVPAGARVDVILDTFSEEGIPISLVEWDGKYGYVKSQYLSGTSSTVIVEEEVCSFALNLRKYPQEGEVLEEIPAGVHFYVISEQNGYKKVAANGRIGYIPAKYGMECAKYTVAGAATTKGSTGSRLTNIRLACRKLTGLKLQSGENFSWLERHGQCTEASGYVPAPVFYAWGTGNGIGGGVCQVATTLHCAVRSVCLCTEVHRHSSYVSYANVQDEAAVSYPGLDFRFQNTSGRDLTLVLYQDGEYCSAMVLVPVS